MKITYIGSGEDSPRKISFMGVLDFKLGESIDVDSKEFALALAERPLLLKKIKGNRCFKCTEKTSPPKTKSVKVEGK